ncbi:MAG TPA: cytochrome c3 family protein [Steroidobacteraceae bacterium]|nr:cytochrome c3 family protein [Steroidobacteraceae bacterium]
MASPTVTWEIGQALGLCAVAACLILCVLAVRPRAGAAGALRLRTHELIGWVALAAAALHVGLLLGVDRLLVEHLKPTAPVYEYAGAVSLLTLLFLTVPAGATVRSRLWPRHRNFQATHVIAACLLVVTLAMHLIGTDRYVHGRTQALAYLLLSGSVLLALLRPRTRRGAVEPRSRLLGGLVFGRHSRSVFAVVLGALIALTALARAATTLALREPLLARNQRLELDFPHDKHRAVRCLLCHHDYLDRSGQGSCVGCHRSARADLRVGAEARFHDFCLGCHRDPPAGLTGHGPVSGCDTCHAPAPAAARLPATQPPSGMARQARAGQNPHPWRTQS